MSIVVVAGLLTTAIILSAKKSEPAEVLVPVKANNRPQPRR